MIELTGTKRIRKAKKKVVFHSMLPKKPPILTLSRIPNHLSS